MTCFKLKLAFLFGLVLAGLSLTSPLAAGETFNARVVSILDGDTIEVVRDNDSLDLVKIRLYGLDAPEDGQPNGRKAAKHLHKLINKCLVQIEVMQKRDRHQRVVGIVSQANQDVGLALAKAGYVWVDERFCKRGEPCNSYRTAVDQARRDKCGLWQDKYQVPPWEWR